MPTVLVVDDLTADRKMAGALLSKITNLSLLYATNGLEALEVLELYFVDAIVTDMQMPEMNGLELVRTVKEHHARIPAILMTAAGSEDIAVEALQIGAVSYVTKKRLTQDLRETVRRVLGVVVEERAQTRLMSCVTEASFELQNDRSLISSLLKYLRQVMRAIQFCDDLENTRICTALDEAFANAYYHGNLEVSSTLREMDNDAYHRLARKRSQEPPYRDRRIHVRVNFSPQSATFVIRDEGFGFDPSSLPNPTDAGYLERPCGRGVFLMRTFMDDMIYNASGNELTLIKRRFVPYD